MKKEKYIGTRSDWFVTEQSTGKRYGTMWDCDIRRDSDGVFRYHAPWFSSTNNHVKTVKLREWLLANNTAVIIRSLKDKDGTPNYQQGAKIAKVRIGNAKATPDGLVVEIYERLASAE